MTKTRPIELAFSRKVDHYHSVQVLQQRDPTHPQLYCKRQIGHLYRSLLNSLGCSTALREQQAYNRALSSPCRAVGS